jgi:Arc/MetJ-type ribon-helix-helix transcriptional regulator
VRSAATVMCIPKWYHPGVSTQIAVRLPDELVAYIDEAVAAGRVKSRAALIARLVERDARRHRAEEDLARLMAAGVLHDADMLSMAKAASSTQMPFD